MMIMYSTIEEYFFPVQAPLVGRHFVTRLVPDRLVTNRRGNETLKFSPKRKRLWDVNTGLGIYLNITGSCPTGPQVSLILLCLAMAGIKHRWRPRFEHIYSYITWVDFSRRELESNWSYYNRRAPMRMRQAPKAKTRPQARLRRVWDSQGFGPQYCDNYSPILWACSVSP